MKKSQPAGKAIGGYARANALSPKRRKEIARRAAVTRWGGGPKVALYEGVIRLAGAEITCYVLNDVNRVFAVPSFVKALAQIEKLGVGRQFEGELQISGLLIADNLKPFITHEIESKFKPIPFAWKGTEMIGYPAELLPGVCEVFQKAERAGKLRRPQRQIANACRVLGRGLTRLGIIELVDEATGYQSDCAAEALGKILEEFTAKELQAWVKTFPNEYYKHLFRLRNMHFPGETPKNPRYFARLTDDIVFARLAPGALEELKNTTPKPVRRRPRQYLHRRLLPDLGHPKLKEHFASVVTIMKLSDSYKEFASKLDRLHPRYGPMRQRPFVDAPKTGI